MLRFAEMPFSVHPEKDVNYIICRKNGTLFAVDYTTEGGWNTHRSIIDGEVYKDAAFTAEQLDRYAYWLRPVEDESLTPWCYDQLIEELVVRCAMALDSKEQKMQTNGSTPGAVDDACFYLNKSIEYLKRMMSMLEGEIN